MASIREFTLQNEKMLLSEHGFLTENTKGRLHDEPECEIRTAFQRDRDRIIHCAAFRRLKHKTQVFLSPGSEHYRTRLTHTLEVSQIARTIAVGLRLNENLTEAIALGHDLGHTPFGHAGERALNEIFEPGFRHYEQSVRVVDRLEKSGKGLNLTFEVRDGILCHTRGKEAETLEGRIVKLADRIAYINHDIDDAIRGKVLSEDEIPSEITKVLGSTKSQRINTLVLSAVRNTTDEIRLDDDIRKAFDLLHSFMFDHVYTNPVCKSEEGKAKNMIRLLFEFFCKNPDKLSSDCKRIADEEGIERAAVDYIAGMTDSYCRSVFEKHFIPCGWQEK